MTIILPTHLVDLRRSGLSDETIRDAGIYSERDGRKIAELLHWRGDAKQLGASCIYPYKRLDGTFNCYARVRPDRPRANGGKYEAPVGVGSRAYFTELGIRALNRLAARIGITEGEKKALCCSQAGIPCIGLAGVWAWQKPRPKDSKGRGQGERLLIDDLSQIDWNGREVPIIFDTDPRYNPLVAQAQSELYRVMSERGAKPFIIVLPTGPADENGIPGKMALDDFAAAYGEDALRQLVESQITVTQTKRLAEYREEMIRNRVSSVGNPGLYLDKSPTGSGKSSSNIPAIQKAGKSLSVVPSHKICEQVEEDYQRAGLIAVAYPQLNDETCQNLAEAEQVLSVGLSPTDAVCTTCPFLPDCDYHQTLKDAENSLHRICTHKRAEFQFSHLAKSRSFITIEEDCSGILKPTLTMARGLDQVEIVATAAKRTEQQKINCDASTEYFLEKMIRVCEMLKAYLSDATETANIELPAAAGAPAHLDHKLWVAMQRSGIYPGAEAMRLAKAIVAGDVAELVVRVDEVFKPGGDKHVGRSIIGVLATEIPEDATTWFCDATADPQELEQLTGRPIVNLTPSGVLERQQAVLQIDLDAKRSTARKRFVEILRAVLLSVPQFNRVGLIADRSHLPAIDGTAKDGILLDVELRQRIVKTAYFRDGSSRGTNGWYTECDLLIVAGTPRVPPSAIKTRLIQAGLSKAARRPDDWVSWGSDFWPGRTGAGKVRVVRCAGYRDHDWRRAYRAIVASELIQAIGRGRAVLDTGIPVLVLSNEPLGLPLVDAEISPMKDAEKAVLDFLTDAAYRKSSLQGQEGATYRKSSLNSIYLDSTSDSTVTTAEVASLSKTTDRNVRMILASLKSRGLVTREGARGGWRLSPHPPIALAKRGGPAAVPDDQPATTSPKEPIP